MWEPGGTGSLVTLPTSHTLWRWLQDPNRTQLSAGGTQRGFVLSEFIIPASLPDSTVAQLQSILHAAAQVTLRHTCGLVTPLLKPSQWLLPTLRDKGHSPSQAEAPAPASGPQAHSLSRGFAHSELGCCPFSPRDALSATSTPNHQPAL